MDHLAAAASVFAILPSLPTPKLVHVQSSEPEFRAHVQLRAGSADLQTSTSSYYSFQAMNTGSYRKVMKHRLLDLTLTRGCEV